MQNLKFKCAQFAHFVADAKNHTILSSTVFTMVKYIVSLE